ncbi:unnamed protein product [marine sediment metagenome]|uniref:Uncharacterized protein n=1 Tax=marine sediment metagenome TaxID=412755 RepID=X1CT61_9ZZZZ
MKFIEKQIKGLMKGLDEKDFWKLFRRVMLEAVDRLTKEVR